MAERAQVDNILLNVFTSVKSNEMDGVKGFKVWFLADALMFDISQHHFVHTTMTPQLGQVLTFDRKQIANVFEVIEDLYYDNTSNTAWYFPSFMMFSPWLNELTIVKDDTRLTFNYREMKDMCSFKYIMDWINWWFEKSERVPKERKLDMCYELLARAIEFVITPNNALNPFLLDLARSTYRRLALLTKLPEDMVAVAEADLERLHSDDRAEFLIRNYPRELKDCKKLVDVIATNLNGRVRYNLIIPERQQPDEVTHRVRQLEIE